MKTLFSLLALTLWLSPNSQADYMIPAMSMALPEITDILDVEVTKMDKNGSATIRVLKAYKSSKQATKTITGTRLSCTGGSPGMFGMKSGQRYIVLLVKDQLYEESSFFPVKVEEGVARCQPHWYGGKTWLNTKGPWITHEEFEAKICAALKAMKASK